MRSAPVVVVVAAVLAAGCGDDEVADSDRAATQTTAAVETTTTAAAAQPSPPSVRDKDGPAETEREEDTPSRSDRELRADQTFYLRTDDDAVALDDAIDRALDGDPSARAAIARLRRRIDRRHTDRLLDSGDQSIAANLLVSAAAAALDALRADDLRRLVDARVDVQEGRDRLAAEFVGP
jgi:hypothetical protein